MTSMTKERERKPQIEVTRVCSPEEEFCREVSRHILSERKRMMDCLLCGDEEGFQAAEMRLVSLGAISGVPMGETLKCLAFRLHLKGVPRELKRDVPASLRAIPSA